jgi:hypothetical protein
MTRHGLGVQQRLQLSEPSRIQLLLRLAGAGLLLATGAIHLDLFLTGYRTIPTIGWLFLVQVIAAFALGLAVLAIPGRLSIASRLAAGAGAGFVLATLGGYLLSVWIGLFGFKEVSTTAGIVAARWRWRLSWHSPRSCLLLSRRTLRRRPGRDCLPRSHTRSPGQPR